MRRQFDKYLTLLAMLACLTTLNLAACSQAGTSSASDLNNPNSPGGQATATLQAAPQQAVDPQTGQPLLNDSEVLVAQDSHAVKTMVTATMQVKKLLAYDMKGRAHQKFLLNASNGTTILVAHSIDSAPKVPIQPGDVITIHGEYIWNAKGGLIHWTHHSDTPRHEGGYIDFNGSRYQ